MKKTSLIVLLAALSLTACKKAEKGATGPAGPTGATGAQGAPGNANVHAGKATLSLSNWGWDATNKTNFANITDADITQDVKDNGTVTVFASTTDGSWLALPYTYNETSSLVVSMGYTYNVGAVRLGLTHSDGSNNVNPYTNCTFKIVAISGAQKRANPATNWQNYKEVMQVLQQTTTNTSE